MANFDCLSGTAALGNDPHGGHPNKMKVESCFKCDRSYCWGEYPDMLFNAVFRAEKCPSESMFELHMHSFHIRVVMLPGGRAGLVDKQGITATSGVRWELPSSSPALEQARLW